MTLPKAFDERIRIQLGDEYEDYIKCFDSDMYHGIRVNTSKISVEDFLKISPFELEPVPWTKNGFYYDHRKYTPSKHPYYYAGLYYIQEPSAMSAAALLAPKPGMRVLDMCTGSGCIIISILKNTTNVDGAACDISKQALNVAKENARLNGVFVDFERSDLFEHVDEMYDVIVSNPPYIPIKVIETLQDEVRLHDPLLALDGTEDGLMFYRKITEKAREYLKTDGYLCYEIGAEQAADVSEIMKQAGLRDITVVKDLAGLDRVVMGRK